MKELKKILVTLFLVLLCLFVFDYAIGYIFDSLRKSLPIDGERTAKTEYVINRMEADIVIVGSSRAQSHYDTYVFRDSFPQMSVFNCGGDGQKFWYCDIITNCIINRYSPKLVIWDFLLSDLEEADENLSLLYPYYSENEYIKNRLLQLDPNLKYQLWCNSYKYNGSGSRILTASRLPKNFGEDRLGYSGHAPLNTINLVFNDFKYEGKQPDALRINQLIQTIHRLKEKNIDLVITLSPIVNKIIGNNTTIETLEMICKENNVIFIDDSQMDGFVGNPLCAYDGGHLNSDAAYEFTKRLVNQMKNSNLLVIE